MRMLLFSERFKSRNLKKKSSKISKMINLSMKLKQKVASCGSQMQKIGGLWVRAITYRAHISPKNVGSLSDHGDNSAENRGPLEP